MDAYKTDLLDLRNMDCMELLKQTPDKAYSLAIIDPPYGLERYKAKDGGNSKKISCFGDGAKKWNNEKPSKQFFDEVFRVSENQIIWGANNFELPQSEYFIVWDKAQMMPSFAQCELAWTSCHVPAKIFTKRSQDLNRIHDTQKPVALYRWLLANYAKEGDRILDTHGGSMSLAIACHYAGYHLTCTEKDADYFQQAVERVKRETQQQTLGI